ncbi:hypothetical protein OIU84_019341 [Salix udensis]|uniref:UspA domain-containing protein n=1 Tax=Salix udensis TaxID=889485 RepID=A0AAD6KYS5_9ROSI|nr:hypothetical protein OIU84_019341 [Salix udensis]
MQLWEVTGSPMIPLAEFSDPVIMKKYKMKPDPETLDLLNTVARQKEIVVVLKIYWGDAREKICEAIDKIPLSCLVIGNRGLGKIKRAIMGSVSTFVVNNGSCPVTVVKQSDHEPQRLPSWMQLDELGPNTVRWAIVIRHHVKNVQVQIVQNAYKNQDLTSKLPLCSLHCYNAIHEKMQPSIARSMKEIDGFIIRNLVLLQRQHG